MNFLRFALCLAIIAVLAFGWATKLDQENQVRWENFSRDRHCHIKTPHKSSFFADQRDLWECDGPFEILH